MTLGTTSSYGPSIILTRQAKEYDTLLRDLQTARREKIKLPMAAAGKRAKKSVQMNFLAGGRPNKWQPLKVREGKPLLDTWKLYNSIHYKVIAGQNFKVYSTDDQGKVAAHDRGRRAMTITAKHKPFLVFRTQSGWRTARSVQHPGIPARPFMHFQTKDIEWVSSKFAVTVMKHMSKHLGGKR